jgi:hypothetical protein
MSKQRYTSSELDARLKFTLGIFLGLILLGTSIGILYALIFVTQPVNAQSENDKMFFNVLGSIATFITGTLAGILIGTKGGNESSATPFDFEAPAAPIAPTPTNDVDPAAKPEGEMPEEQDIDEDWDKD